MTVLVIDNYDSFTWNLVQLVGALGGEPRVARNDAITVAEVRSLRPSHVVLSPGPGHPDEPARGGICRALLDALPDVPVLGVCLGHQILVSAFGGRILQGAPVHGKTSEVFHEGVGLLAGLPSPFEAMRYHSLIADPSSIPADLEVTAWCKDGTVMGVRHRRRPLFGVQFHPESVGTPYGRAIVASFLSTSGRASRGASPSTRAEASRPERPVEEQP